MTTPGDGLVGRRRELDALRVWLDGARGGTGRLVLCAGEPGIGKTRLAQEFAGIALAGGVTVTWGRCAESDGAPAFWPWHQLLRTIGRAEVLEAPGDTPGARFRLYDDVVEALDTRSPLLVILDDIHRGDEPSLLLLRHVAERLADRRVLIFAGFRDAEPDSVLPQILPDLLRAPSTQRIDLRGLDLAAVESLTPSDAEKVLDITGGNPLFVREVARAITDGTWRPDHPPRTVLEVVAARLARVSSGCRAMLQAAAIVGREFPVALVSAATEVPIRLCLSAVDEAIGYGLVEPFGVDGGFRFAHALTRDAVEASVELGERIALHRAVATAIERQHAEDLTEHLADLARHWAALAPYGEAATARAWTVRAADDAVRRLAYEEGVRRYRTALTLGPVPDEERCRILVALGGAARQAGDLAAAVDAAGAAGRAATSPELLADAALVVEAVPDPAVNAVVRQLSDEALAATIPDAWRARLLAARSHLAFYDGDQDGVASLSRDALTLARACGDDSALHDALRARKEACPGPAGLAERTELATEMVDLAARSGSALSAMWGRLWKIETLVECGHFAEASDELPVLTVAVERLGGPVSWWHRDRAAACIAQAQARFEDARVLSRRAFDRMRPVEEGPATGAYFALQCALVRHVGMTEEAAAFVAGPFEGPPRFRTLQKLSRAALMLSAGMREEALASYQQAGPMQTWSLPVFFVLPAHVYATVVAVELGLRDQMELLLDRLEPHRGRHAIGDGVAYLGPIELALGRLAAGLGRWERAVSDLSTAVDVAHRCGAPGYVAEARLELAAALLETGDRAAASRHAHAAEGLVRSLGMAACGARCAELLAASEPGSSALSPREQEVARLVAEGLTNRGIAERLVISERTAQTHVAHILAKLDLANRSQIAAWVLRPGEPGRNE